nr:MAG TPA: hypothetical protein [Caudoviricetes sp.]
MIITNSFILFLLLKTILLLHENDIYIYISKIRI